MKLSTRLTRAGAAFAVFGIVASAVPNSGMIPAGACGGSSSNNTGAYVAGGVVVLGGAYYLSGGLKPKPHNPSHNPPVDNTPTNTTTTPTSDSQWNDLHGFVYGNN